MPMKTENWSKLTSLGTALLRLANSRVTLTLLIPFKETGTASGIYKVLSRELGPGRPHILHAEGVLHFKTNPPNPINLFSRLVVFSKRNLTLEVSF
jgi:hypothetical protein